MSFTITFNPTLSTSSNIVVSGCTFTTSDNGLTYTTSDLPSFLSDFNAQTWTDKLFSVVNIPSSVTMISYACFEGCSKLSSITIPSSVTIIDEASFADCISLTSITIPSSVTVISNAVFAGCSSLSSITILGNITSFGATAFNLCSSLSSITIPSGVTSIGNFCFNGCTSLSSIIIPSSVTNIGRNAFSNCTSLYSIKIPSSVTTIGILAFLGIPSNSSPTPLNAATLYTKPLDILTNPVYSYFKTNFTGSNQINYIEYPPPPPPIVCFKEDSKILTNKGYLPIQDLRKGDLVKTFKNGYKPIDMIGFREIYNPICEERIKDKLYICTNDKYSEIFEDLVITGCHSILVDNYKNQAELEKTKEVNGHTYNTDGKWRLPACVDIRAKPYENEGTFTIYHLALENDDYYMNYGIYANGLLVETCSKRYLKELSNMTLIE